MRLLFFYLKVAVHRTTVFTMKSLEVALACLLFNAVISVRGDPLDAWHWRNPSPFGHSMSSCVFGAGRFVAVGSGGMIHTSVDGVAWDDGRRPVLSTLNRLIHANGQFVAVGDGGVVVTSEDGLSWTLRSSGTTNRLLGISFQNGIYVACGAAGQLSVSSDGHSWTAASTGSTDDLLWIVGGQGVFVMQSSANFTPRLVVQVSTNGLNWTTYSFEAVISGPYQASPLGLSFANGRFLLSAAADYRDGPVNILPAIRFFVSTNGRDWTKSEYAVPSSTPIEAHRFLAVANGAFHEFVGSLRTTTDGNSFSVSTVPVEASDAVDLAYGNGRYVLLGTSGKVWTSSTGTNNWSAAYGGYRTPIYQIIRGAENFVAVGSSMPILISSDGINFDPAPNSSPEVLNGVAFDGSNYVAVGESGLVKTSTNSLVWTTRPGNTAQNLLGVCRGANRWAAVGANGTIITSPTTLVWTLRNSGTANTLRSVAFGNGLYVAVGNAGTIVTSPDGAVWDVQFSDTATNLFRVAFLNGQFIAVGDSGLILTSADGVSWNKRVSGVTTPLSGVTYGNGKYVAIGYLKNIHFGRYENVLLQSSNAVNWENITGKLSVGVPPFVHSLSLLDNNALTSISFLDQSYWITGDGLLQSDTVDGVPRIAGKMLSAGAGFQIKTVLNAPERYLIEGRTNLTSGSWQTLADITNAWSPVWIDTNAASTSVGFYRIVSP